jgi:type III secretion system low calcium response chaperone LcrH/SycD
MKPEEFDAEFLDKMSDMFARGLTMGDAMGYDDRDYAAVYALGHQMYTQGRYVDAIKAFGFLALHDHLEPKYMMAFASALQMTKRYAEALTYYSQASMFDLTDPVPTYHSAECMIALGNIEDARAALAIVVRDCAGQSEYEELLARAQSLLAIIDTSIKDQGLSEQ